MTRPPSTSGVSSPDGKRPVISKGADSSCLETFNPNGRQTLEETTYPQKKLDGAFFFLFFCLRLSCCLSATGPLCLGAVDGIMQGRSIRVSTFGTSMRYVAQNAQETYTPHLRH